jgi:hypothetical protein
MQTPTREDRVTETNNLVVTWFDTTESGKTSVFSVHSKARIILGKIAWYSQWRAYVFYPMANTLFDKACLKELAEVCEVFTIEHKQRPQV